MSFSLSSSSSFPSTRCQNHRSSAAIQIKHGLSGGSVRQSLSTTSCELKETAPESGASSAKELKLKIGSPIIVTEAPKMLKTAASVPCLRANSGLVKPGDVGRIMSRKPKDVWAVRLAIGTYLIDGKYFKPLELDDE